LPHPARGRLEQTEAIVKRLMLVALAAALLVGWTIGPAFTHTATLSSKVKLTVSDATPKKGADVTFKGKVTANKAKCYKDRKVQLIRNTKVVKTKLTNADGVVKFTKPISSKGTFWLKAKKKNANLAHPHTHVCAKVLSNEIKIQPHQ
jgi:hypothetical protein